MLNITDSKFFTNEPNHTLYDRFNQILTHTKYFDVLVGYFRASGFYKLQSAFDNIEHVRILVGLNIDKITANMIKEANIEQTPITSDIAKEWVSNQTINDVVCADDTKEIEDGIHKFVSFLKSGKIEIRAYPSHDIHAKVYIMRHPEGFIDYGRVVTGSSNFSENGLIAQREFNVELKDKPDVDFALEKFEELWNDGTVDVTQLYIDTILKKTPANKEINPYDLYLKFLYEYFKDEIDDDLTAVNINLPTGFMELQYQHDAVKNAKRILEKYNGVFLADVVGLGKTFITAMLLQILDDGQKLILCPPNLVDYWDDTLRDFNVPGYKVASKFSIDDNDYKQYEKFKYIVIDEAHSFRNKNNIGYAKLHDVVCKGKKVILVSATPFNNDLSDIDSLLRLFMNMKKSPLPGLENLEAFFVNRRTELKRIENYYGKGSEEYKDKVKLNANLVRENILRPLMVRRTRTEIKQDYKSDIEKQHLKFPEVNAPQKLIYEFSDKIEEAFDKTIDLLKQDGTHSKFKYARYTPLLYLKKPKDGKIQQQQRNTGYFMKQLLVKRLESSFYAFKQSLNRFEKSYVDFINMYKSGTVYVGKKDIAKYIEDDDDAAIERFLAEGKIDKYDSSEFDSKLLKDLESDLEIIRQLINIWSKIQIDPKFDQLKAQLNKLKNQQVIIFTESKDTADYLFDKLTENVEYNNITFEISGNCGRQNYNSNSKIYNNVKAAKERIEVDFNPSCENEARCFGDQIKVLLTTDILSEGVNLHKANQLINYDLPWNPTRIMQRVGRINRVGTKHDNIYTYSFFPTSQGATHLGLEDNIKAKIAMFQNMLGDDNPLLDQDEEPQQHHLSDQLYNNIESSLNISETEISDPTNHYLKIIRDIRDTDPTLYNRIKSMPKKIKTAQNGKETGLVTFFRKGLWKDFVYTTKDNEHSEHLAWQDAIRLFECTPNTKSISLPDIYYELIQKNKECSMDASNIFNNDDAKVKANPIANHIVKIILTLMKNKQISLDDDEKKILSEAQHYIPDMAKKNLTNMKNALDKLLKTAQDKVQTLQKPEEKNKLFYKLSKDTVTLIKSYYKYWKPTDAISVLDTSSNREIILSKCFVGDK